MTTYMINNYRKRPVVIQAIQNRLENSKEVMAFIIDNNALYKIEEGDIYITTLEGNMKVSENDYIIRGVEGELYPCRSDIFEKTYESI